MQIGDSMSHTQSIMDSMANFANTAAAGGFEVSDTGGEPLLKAIDGFQRWVDDHSDRITMLEQERKLGTSNAAQVMAPFVKEVVTDDQGFVTQLKALRDSLNKAREGIQKAMENYRQTEEANRANMKGIDI
jgi:hypothetical protein